MRPVAREGLIAALGFFSLVGQTLLFRDWLGSLEGNEIAVGLFFGSWLFWVGAGAVGGRWLVSRWAWPTRLLPGLSLLYIPAFLLQYQMIFNARAILGLQSFVLVPLPSLLGFAAIANGPVSLFTGALFALACSWSKEAFALPVARVYILETVGGFLGGLFVTALLTLGVPGGMVFSFAVLIFLLPVMANLVPNSNRPQWSLAMAGGAVAAAFGIVILGKIGAEHADRSRWSRLLPVDGFHGSFTTPQSKYLYGEREGDFIVINEGGVIETLPEEEHSSAVAAWAMAQNPKASKVLVVGPGGFAIGRRLHLLPQIEEVVWLSPDPVFPSTFLEILPKRFRDRQGIVATPPVEVRTYLAASPGTFDLVIMTLPEVTTLVANRYFTRSFFQLVREALAPGGVCGVRVSGGANYIGGELGLAGASAWTTMASGFPHLVVKPGDESFIYGSREPVVHDQADALVQRFTNIPGSLQLYPIEGLKSNFLADRITFQLNRYRDLEERYGNRVLGNTDDHPKVLLYNLLLTLRRAGVASFTGGVAFLMDWGVAICLGAMILYGLLRILYTWKGARSKKSTGPDTGRALVHDMEMMLLFAGVIGMSATLVLMFCYQIRFGSLFLDVGLISSLFMLGSAVGGLLSERLLLRHILSLPRLTALITVGECLFFTSIIFFLPQQTTRPMLGLFFTVAGLFSGLYFPMAAEFFRSRGRDTAVAAGRLELLDHLGGATGGLVTGIFLLPLFGVQASLTLLIVTMVTVNCVFLVLGNHGEVLKTGDRFDQMQRPLGYLLCTIGIFTLLISQMYHITHSGRQEAAAKSVAAAMMGGKNWQEKTVSLPDGTALYYYTFGGEFLFPSAPLVTGIRGYGGEIGLLVHLDTTGLLKDFRLLPSRETPAYIAFLREWLGGLKGRSMFTDDPFFGIDAVTGATMSSTAIIKTLDMAVARFGAVVLGQAERDKGSRPPQAALPWQFLLLLAWTAVAIVARYRPDRQGRRVILFGSFFLFGFLLNHQYATQQLFALLSGQFPGAINAGFFLIILVPLLVALFGNIYCGYLCPFGALQELLGDLRPKRVQSDPRKKVWRYGRVVKYLLLFLFVLLFAVTRDFSVLHADPLITFFGAARDIIITVLAICLLGLALFFRRFWCRNLCPAGAFLALLGGLRLFGSLLPKTRPQLCDLGVRNTTELDCIQCDRCRHEKI